MATHPVDIAINIVVPFDVIVERVQGRWVHLPSGRVYNTGFKPPKHPVSWALTYNFCCLICELLSLL